jgi:septal ring factor EnvC (AmiA/AmiB activator)
MIDLAANLLVAFLLVLTTSWCVLLYRRLGLLRVERRDIEAFVTAIDVAARRAEQAISGIRETAAETQRALDAEQQQAQQRAGELARLLDSATRMARRIESAVHQGARAMAEEGLARERSAERNDPAATSKRGAPAAGGEEPATRSGRPRIDAELLKALEALR